MPNTETCKPSPARIKYALALAGYTQTDVAAECGVEPNTVWSVIHGRSRSSNIEMRVAAATGLPLTKLWPQWYGPDARHNRRRRRSSAAEIAETLQSMVG